MSSATQDNSQIEQSHASESGSIKRNIPANCSFKDLKKSYHLKKKYFTKNIQSAIDSTQEVHSGWLKARTTFKRWTKVWCQVKPGYLIMYTTQEAQKKHRLGVVLLSVCQVMKRPSKKEGYCFKLINPFGVSVWAKSSTRALAFSQASLTLRASDSLVGKLWIDAFNKCNLSINLDGYKPVVDEEIFIGNRSDLNSDSEDDYGDQSTRHIESIMLHEHSDDTSNTNSVSSNNINIISNNNNCHRSSSIAGISNNNQPSTNGTTPLNALKPTSKLFSNNSNTINSSSFKVNKNRLINNSCTNSQFGVNKLNNIRNINNNLNVTNSSLLDSNENNNNPAFNVMEDKIETIVTQSCKYNWTELQLENIKYILDGAEELGSVGVQSEDVHESNKSLLWHIIKQLRPGMDLSKVPLPTFILEPRSFLEKLADYYYHCDILSDAVLIDDPVMRMINIVKWYLSGFYKKPKGPKKPYNPILGERFRCFWDHPKTQSRTFFIAEQVSHHPPISAFHVTNRKDGYTITCALLSKSKYGGNSVSAILEGKARLYLTKRKETYILTMPYANCRGILLGSLCLELGGKVEISCPETDCKCELDFKLAPVWSSPNSYNTLSGKILNSNKITHTLDGHWDKKITILNKQTEKKSVLWEVTDTVRNSRLKRYTVAMRDQGERESVKLWSKVSEALLASDQIAATVEKTRLEDMQRQEAKDRRGIFEPDHFKYDSETSDWHYKWQDDRAWTDNRDIMQFEDNFKIKTLVSRDSATLLQGESSSTLSYSIQQNRNMLAAHDPNIDMPLTMLNKYEHMIGIKNELLNNKNAKTNRKKSIATTSRRQTNPMFNDGGRYESDPDKFKSIESNFDIMSEAIKKVSDANKKLEHEVATLKRGRKAVALIMAAIIVAVLSWYFNYFSY